jgi:hypothetical protein
MWRQVCHSRRRIANRAAAERLGYRSDTLKLNRQRLRRTGAQRTQRTQRESQSVVIDIRFSDLSGHYRTSEGASLGRSWPMSNVAAMIRF